MFMLMFHFIELSRWMTSDLKSNTCKIIYFDRV
jgi:hypothetical protein